MVPGPCQARAQTIYNQLRDSIIRNVYKEYQVIFGNNILQRLAKACIVTLSPDGPAWFYLLCPKNIKTVK